MRDLEDCLSAIRLQTSYDEARLASVKRRQPLPNCENPLVVFGGIGDPRLRELEPDLLVGDRGPDANRSRGMPLGNTRASMVDERQTSIAGMGAGNYIVGRFDCESQAVGEMQVDNVEVRANELSSCPTVDVVSRTLALRLAMGDQRVQDLLAQGRVVGAARLT